MFVGSSSWYNGFRTARGFSAVIRFSEWRPTCVMEIHWKLVATCGVSELRCFRYKKMFQAKKSF